MTDVVLDGLRAPGAVVGDGARGGPPPDAAPFAIVPVKALPIAAAAIVGLIVAIATKSPWAIDCYHVASGGLWTGLDLFLGFVIGPILAKLSVPARIEVTKRLMPKMLVIMPTLVICTLAAGWQLARQIGDLNASYAGHPWVIASFIVVGVMALVAIGILEPANVAVLFELRKPDPDGRVIAGLMRRFILTAGITGAMQVATLLIMTKLATT